MTEDPRGWVSELVRQHGRMVFTTAFRILGSVEDAEDVLQDVFLKICNVRSERENDPIQQWGAYLRIMASRMAIDRLRQQQKDQRMMSTLKENGPRFQEDDSTRHAADQHQAHLLRQALSKLAPQEAEIFALKHLEDFRYEEIAARLKLSVNQVGVILHRARKHLREIINRIAVI